MHLENSAVWHKPYFPLWVKNQSHMIWMSYKFWSAAPAGKCFDTTELNFYCIDQVLYRLVIHLARVESEQHSVIYRHVQYKIFPSGLNCSFLKVSILKYQNVLNNKERWATWKSWIQFHCIDCLFQLCTFD